MRVRKPEKVDLSLKDLITKETLLMENLMETANITSPTLAKFTKETLLRTTCTERESWFGQIKQDMRANSEMAAWKVKELSSLPMGTAL